MARPARKCPVLSFRLEPKINTKKRYIFIANVVKSPYLRIGSIVRLVEFTSTYHIAFEKWADKNLNVNNAIQSNNIQFIRRNAKCRMQVLNDLYEKSRSGNNTGAVNVHRYSIMTHH